MRDGVQIFDLEIPLLSKSVSRYSNYLPSLRLRVKQQQQPFFLHPEPRVSLLRHGSSAPQLHPSFLDTAADSCLLLDGVKESAGRQERQIPRPPSRTPHRFVRRGERDPSSMSRSQFCDRVRRRSAFRLARWSWGSSFSWWLGQVGSHDETAVDVTFV